MHLGALPAGGRAAPSGWGGSPLPLGTPPGQILKILSSVSHLTSRPRLSCKIKSNTLKTLIYDVGPER